MSISEARHTADPIFAAIETHRKAFQEWEIAIEEVDVTAQTKHDNADEHRSEADAADARQFALAEIQCDALKSLCQTRPTSVAGIAAMLEYLGPICGEVLDGMYTNGATKGLLTSIGEAARALAT